MDSPGFNDQSNLDDWFTQLNISKTYTFDFIILVIAIDQIEATNSN